MKKHFLVALAAVALLAGSMSSQTTAATVTFDEAVDGELSGDNLAPTSLGVFDIGTNTVTGSVVDALGTDPNVDVFTFSIAADTFIESLVLTDFNSTDDVGFLGLNDSDTFPFDATELSNGPDQSQFIGGVLFGDVVGSDLLGALGDGTIGAGFSGPLGEGDYTVYVQQLGGATIDYQLSFSVAAIPEPSSACILGLGLVGLANFRRKRK